MTLLQHQLLVCGDEREGGREGGGRREEEEGGASGGESMASLQVLVCVTVLSSCVFLPLVGILCDNYVGDASHLLHLLVIDRQWKELESLFQ